MSYYLAYYAETNQLVYLDENPPTGLPATYTVEHHPEEVMPRLDLFGWNPSSLSFYRKPKKLFTQLEFLDRFTMEERIAIRAATKTDPIAFDINDQFNQSNEILLDDPHLIQGINYFGYVGLLTPERVRQILEG